MTTCLKFNVIWQNRAACSWALFLCVILWFTAECKSAIRWVLISFNSMKFHNCIPLRDTNPSCLTSQMMTNLHHLKVTRHRTWHAMKKPIRTSSWKRPTHRKGRESYTSQTSISTASKRWLGSLRTSMGQTLPLAVLSGIYSNTTLTPTAKPSVRW